MDSKELRSLMEAYQKVSAPQEVEEGVRDLDPEKGTSERKARLEKKRGMKLDDHPEYKKEEVEQVDEADSLAAMAARREKRLAAQRKREGTTVTGRDFGHDYGISSAERKKRQQAEFDKFVGRGKKTTKEEFDAFDVILEFLIDEEIAQDIQEANWIMANAITEEQIDEILGMLKKKAEKKTEYAGRSMKKPAEGEKKGYTVDKRGPEVSVTSYGKGGKTVKFKTRGRV